MFPVDAFRHTLEKAARILRKLDIRFHLTGGVTSVLYGEPRMTQDIGIVVDQHLLRDQLVAFTELLRESGFILDDASIRQAVAQGGIFQLLDGVEALKLDFFARERFPGELDRSCLVELFESVELPVASPADAAASKLVWISKGSHRSRRDLRQMHRSVSEGDRQRIRQLAERLQLTRLLDEVLSEPDELA